MKMQDPLMHSWDKSIKKSSIELMLSVNLNIEYKHNLLLLFNTILKTD